jgi:hypothetical protein
MEMFKISDEAHLKVMTAMYELMKSPEAMDQWFESKKSEFEALPNSK